MLVQEEYYRHRNETHEVRRKTPGGSEYGRCAYHDPRPDQLTTWNAARQHIAS